MEGEKTDFQSLQRKGMKEVKVGINFFCKLDINISKNQQQVL